MKYTAITIGPIFRTLQKARSTKAIWSASYLFSHLMKQIYIEVIKEIKKEDILLPFVSNKMLKDNFKIKAGLFPDRIIFEGELQNFDGLKKTVIERLSKLIAKDLKENESEVLEYLQKYLLIKSISKEFEDDDKKDNVVKIMDDYLNVQELQQQTYNQESKKDYLKLFLELKSSGYNTFIKQEFGTQPFQSINQIATALLNHSIKDDSEKGQEAFYKKVKKECENYKPIHKYIAIVQADGDNIGHLIKTLSETSGNFKNDIQAFSEKLYDFSLGALKIINEWKGTPIYAGGDDLLFFAPVADVEDQKVTQTILNVCKEISDKFNEIIIKQYKEEYKKKHKKDLTLKKKPSMSFGINISYYKFPLDQSLSFAYNELKNAKNGGRNAIALNVIKHSGQQFGTVFKQDAETFLNIEGFLKDKENGDFIANFMYKLDSLKTVIQGIGMIDNEKNRNNRFKSFLMNYFDEEVHRKKGTNETEMSEFLKVIEKLLQSIYKESPLYDCTQDQQQKQNDKNIAKLYSVLRYSHFIHAKKEQE